MKRRIALGMRSSLAGASTILAVVGLVERGVAQSALTPAPQFEAASVKRVAPIAPEPYVPGLLKGGPGTSDPGRIKYSGIGLRGLLTLAYGLQRYQVIGPDWLDSERYDVNATIRAGATKEEVNAMLRNLLAERFHPSVHHENRELLVYELTIAKGGPKLKPSAADPGPLPVTPEPARLDKNGSRLPIPGLPSIGFSIREGVVHLTAKVQTIASLANVLYNNFQLGVPVLDKTGLTGTYDFALDFAPEQVQTAAALSPDAPSLSVAIEDQLGLRLEQKKGPVEVLVVGHADRIPTDN